MKSTYICGGPARGLFPVPGPGRPSCVVWGCGGVGMGVTRVDYAIWLLFFTWKGDLDSAQSLEGFVSSFFVCEEGSLVVL